MTAPPLTAPLRVERFTASRDQPCTSGADCDGVKVGQPAAYVGWPSGSGAACGVCLPGIEARNAELLGEAPAEVTSGPLPVAVDPHTVTDLRDLLRTAMDQAGRVDTEKLSEASRREIAGLGWILRGADGVWSVTTAGYGELGGQSQVDEHGWPADGDAIQPAPALPEGDDPADTAAQDDVHTCECRKVTSRAKFGRTPDGRPTHEHCGGLLREKHYRYLPDDQRPDTTAPEETTDDAPDHQPGPDSAEHGADGTVAGADPGAGEPPRSADGAPGRGEGGEGGRGDAGEGARRGDQDGDGGAGAGGSADPQPAHPRRVEVRDPDGQPLQHEGVPGGVPAGRAAVDDDQHGDQARPREVGGLAAFYAQPDDEPEEVAPSAPPVVNGVEFGNPDYTPPASVANPTSTAPATPLPTSADRSGNPPAGPVGTHTGPSTLQSSAVPAARPRGGEAPTAGGIQRGGLAAFYAQPDEDSVGDFDCCLPDAAPNPPDSDNYLGEFSLAELVGEIERRYPVNVLGLVLSNRDGLVYVAQVEDMPR